MSLAVEFILSLSLFYPSEVDGCLEQLLQLLHVSTHNCLGDLNIAADLSDEDVGGEGVDVELGGEFVCLFSVYSGVGHFVGFLEGFEMGFDESAGFAGATSEGLYV